MSKLPLENDLSLPNGAQAALQVMREQLRLAQLDHGRYSLEGMAASNRSSRTAAGNSGRAHLERQETAPDRDDMLLGLGEVVVHEDAANRGARSLGVMRPDRSSGRQQPSAERP